MNVDSDRMTIFILATEIQRYECVDLKNRLSAQTQAL
jgi:hypothetical protein